ncbi:MAG: thiamine diphosphokinase [Actinomycetota bacterium]|nr:thiamine diphosphokinase [Actinomycetota bacterium]
MTTSKTRGVVITGGHLNTEPDVGVDDFVIVADSGYDHAMARSISVDLLIGDLDSISDTGLSHARNSGVEIEAHSAQKAQTDLELAVSAAVTRGADSIDIYGGEGGRLDHLLSAALSLTNPAWRDVRIAWHTSSGVVRVVTPSQPLSVTVTVGQTVTLLPVGDAHSVTTSGLRWPLTDESLTRGVSRGVSNKAITNEVSIEVGQGAVLVIIEGEEF